MIKGGYQILDFTGITQLDGSETLPGAFNKIKTCGKPILVHNLNGINVFTSDADIASTTQAVLPAYIMSGGTPTLLAVTITSADVVSILS